MQRQASSANEHMSITTSRVRPHAKGRRGGIRVSRPCIQHSIKRPSPPSRDPVEAFLRGSRWIRRGWTLQELLAPPIVQFYDASWNMLTTRADSAGVLARVTGIHECALRDMEPDATAFGGCLPSEDRRLDLKRFSIAQRMCWAANRETTRAEDRAYSLLGLFGVVMPLFYGEGQVRAFRRLQHEIIRSSSDQSIFAWVCPEHSTGLFARDLKCYKSRSHVVPRQGTSAFRSRQSQKFSASYFLGNRGLHISVPILSSRDGDVYQAVLNCRSVDDPARIFLLNLFHAEDNEYCVIDSHYPRCTETDWWKLPSSNRTNTCDKQDIIIRPSWDEFSGARRSNLELVLRLEDKVTSPKDQRGLSVHAAYPTSSWSEDNCYYRGPLETNLGLFHGAATLSFYYGTGKDLSTVCHLLLTFSHREYPGKTHFSFEVSDKSAEDASMPRNNHLYGDTSHASGPVYHSAEGCLPLHAAFEDDMGTAFSVVLQEIEIFGDIVCELRLTRHIAGVSPTLSISHEAIFDESLVPLERLAFIPYDGGWTKCKFFHHLKIQKLSSSRPPRRLYYTFGGWI